MTKIVGLTGGIGSGKTMIVNHIKSLGIPVYIADEEAKGIMQSPTVIQEIINVFGTNVLKDGKISREKLAELVFNNNEELQKLNKIVHPIVKKHFKNWVKNHSQFPFVIKEAAILFESGSNKDCDVIITVTAPIETRIQRVIERDKTDRETVLKRIQSQWSDEQKMLKSDYVIHNISVNETKKEIDRILKKLENI